jgi:hypothetical protein
VFLLINKSPGRNPGRVLNPISYEKPDTIVSIHMPNSKYSTSAGFSNVIAFTMFHFGKICTTVGLTLMHMCIVDYCSETLPNRIAANTSERNGKGVLLPDDG